MKELFTPEIAQKIDKMGFDYDANNLVIYVVASTAGGTGSGIFIDMGFLLRKVFRDRSYQANGVIVLPGAFSNYSECKAIHTHVLKNLIITAMATTSRSTGVDMIRWL